MSYRYPTVLYNRKIDWDEPIPYSYAEIKITDKKIVWDDYDELYKEYYKKDKTMAKDVDGKEVKIGDTVEVVDGSGDYYFKDKVGEQFVIIKIINKLVYVDNKNAQFSHRFKRIDKMTYKVGTKLKYKYDDKTDYFVEYVNADGALLYYVNSGFIKYYFFLDNKGLTEYSEIKPEQWVYMYKDSYGKVYVSSFFTSREDAEKAGRSNYETSGRFISVVRTDKTE